MSRPTISAAVFGALTAQAPTRVTKRLDAEPKAAEKWAWSGDGTTVTTDNGETVRLSPQNGTLSEASQLSCSCLLNPKCFHLLAVASVLEIDAATPVATKPEAPVQVAESITLTADQRRAATLAFRAGAELLLTGATGAGTVLQGELLRSVHACRIEGLARLAACGLRLVKAVRELREERPEFERAGFFADLAEWLLVSHALSTPEVTAGLAALLGVGRRAYDDAGHLKLYGLFSEPVLSRTGYGGATTVLTDGTRFYSLGNVQPGGAERILQAYLGGAKLGGGSVTHQTLCRGSLLIEGATVSEDGRLGAGSQVKAVAGAPAGWNTPPLAALFQIPLATQLERILEALTQPAELQNPGETCLFAEGRVLGLANDALLFQLAGHPPLVLTSPSLLRVLPSFDNLHLLARADGLPLRIIARVNGTRRRSAQLLAFGPPANPTPEDKAPQLLLPEEWRGVCNLGLDRLQRSHLSTAATEATALGLPDRRPTDPLAPLRQRLERLAMGGLSTLPSAVLPQTARESAAYTQRLMPQAARLLDQLARAAQRGPGFTPAHLARSFAAAGAYLSAAHRRLEQALWLT